MVATHRRFQSLVRTTPLSGLTHAPDRVLLLEDDPVLVVAVIDAVGQGTAALRSVETAEAIANRVLRAAMAEAFVEVHQALVGRPGVSLGVARIDFEARRLTFAGVGRVYGLLAGRAAETLLSEPGTLGVGLPKVPVGQTFAFGPGDLLCLATDGLVDIWDVAPLWRHPAASLPFLLGCAAGAVNRLPDDASIVMVRAE
jgi:hypothetical protein